MALGGVKDYLLWSVVVAGYCGFVAGPFLRAVVYVGAIKIV